MPTNLSTHLFIFLITLVIFIGDTYADELFQPLEVRQNNPAMLRFFDPVPMAAPLKGKSLFTFSQSYSSIFLADSLPKSQRYLADMELYKAEFAIAHHFQSPSTLILRIPVLRPNAGVMDPFLRQYHRTLRLPNGGRKYRPDNQYAYKYLGATKGWNGSPRWELGNIQAQWRYELKKITENTRLSPAMAIKLPSASSARGWSNGGIDVSAGVIAKSNNQPWAVHAEAWWIHPLKRNDMGNNIQDYIRSSFSLGYAASYPFKVTWIGQVQGGTSPYKTGLSELDQSPWLISIGARIEQKSNLAWQIAFVENITQASTQDFGVSIDLQVPLEF